MLPILGAVKGLAGIAGGLIGSGKRKRELRDAQTAYNRQMANFKNLDTSNAYANMENTMEDLTVNQGQAQFAAEQQQQALANTMSGLQGAAGGSGIAALAQSLAGQQSQNLRTASVSIGQQEQANQMAERNMAGQLDMQERAGELQSRQAKKSQTETLLGMSQQRLGAAKAAKAAATKSIIGGVTGLAGAVLPSIPGLSEMGGGDGQFGFMENMMGAQSG
jgi:hypothetical protein